MVWPSGTPIETLALRDVKTTLEGIAPPNYKHTMRAVKIAGRTPWSILSYPHAVIGVPRFEWSDRRGCLDEVSMLLTIALVNRDSTEQVWENLFDLFRDAKLALEVDHTRGGAATDTSVTTSDPYALSVADPLYGLDMNVTIKLRNERGDPTTAH